MEIEPVDKNEIAEVLLERDKQDRKSQEDRVSSEREADQIWQQVQAVGPLKITFSKTPNQFFIREALIKRVPTGGRFLETFTESLAPIFYLWFD